jgi:hypothetical protein
MIKDSYLFALCSWSSRHNLHAEGSNAAKLYEILRNAFLAMRNVRNLFIKNEINDEIWAFLERNTKRNLGHFKRSTGQKLLQLLYISGVSQYYLSVFCSLAEASSRYAYLVLKQVGVTTN